MTFNMDNWTLPFKKWTGRVVSSAGWYLPTGATKSLARTLCMTASMLKVKLLYALFAHPSCQKYLPVFYMERRCCPWLPNNATTLWLFCDWPLKFSAHNTICSEPWRSEKSNVIYTVWGQHSNAIGTFIIQLEKGSVVSDLVSLRSWVMT